MTDTALTTAWATIEAELAVQFPAVRSSLAAPATPLEIARLEKRCNVKLPDDLRASLLRHNGQIDRQTLNTFANGATLLSVDAIIATWIMWQDLAGDSMLSVYPSNDTSKEIATNRVWHPKWLPFTETCDGNYHVMDFAPRSKGTMGQIFKLAHGEPGDVLATSYTQWLERIASKLVSRDYYDDSAAELNTPWFSGYDV